MSPEAPVLYGYWRSTAAYRVRIALNLKGLEWHYKSVHLVRDGGEQHAQGYRELNPAGLVPVLICQGQRISQSLAICEFLEEVYPQPALLPAAPGDRALVRALAQDVACEIHPLNNLRVQQYLGRELGADATAREAWMHHWMAAGFETMQQRLEQDGRAGDTCLGGAPGLAELCLVAQAYNADRFGFSLQPYPLLEHIVAHCRALPAFAAAAPEQQPDAS
ncbi:MAG: maleylacetoacetate isomerase [Xanthomonadales bacterium]|nr:maleylacetoacetate isomerase [Xanthomonadales bacterium]